MKENIILIKNLTKTYKLYDRNVSDRLKDIFFPGKKKRFSEFNALKNIKSKKIKKGEIVGFIGRNGAGKSTLMKIISKITQPSKGEISVYGKVVPLLGLGSGFNVDYTGKDNIFFYCSLLGMHKEEVNRIYNDIVDFSELGDFIDVPVKKYSNGMKARLAFSVSIYIDPDILILDEVLAVGDELFKRKCFLKMQEFFESGKTILFVSHSMSSINEICNKVVLIHKGELVLSGKPDLVIPRYQQLINSPEKHQQKVLEAFRNIESNPDHKETTQQEINSRKLGNNISASAKKAESKIEETEKTSSFDPQLTSSISKKITKKKVIFEDITIKNHNGLKVNTLKAGEIFQLDFSIVFDENLEHVSILAVLYNDQNKALCSHWFPGKARTIRNIARNHREKIKLKFNTYMAPGIYGIKIIVNAKDKESNRIIATWLDAIVFRVLPDEVSTYNSGILRFFERPAEKKD